MIYMYQEQTIPFPEVKAVSGDSGENLKSRRQCCRRTKKPRPAGQVKYRRPPKVPSEHADCSSSYGRVKKEQ